MAQYNREWADPCTYNPQDAQVPMERILFIGGPDQHERTVQSIPKGYQAWELIAEVPDYDVLRGTAKVRRSDADLMYGVTPPMKTIRLPYERMRVACSQHVPVPVYGRLASSVSQDCQITAVMVPSFGTTRPATPWAASYDFNTTTTGVMRVAEEIVRRELGLSWCFLPKAQGFFLADLRRDPIDPGGRSPVVPGDPLRVISGVLKWLCGTQWQMSLQWKTLDESVVARTYRMMDFKTKNPAAVPSNGKYLCIGGPQHGTVREAGFRDIALYELRKDTFPDSGVSHYVFKELDAAAIQSACQTLHNPHARADTASGLLSQIETVIQSRYPTSYLHKRGKQLLLLFFDHPAVVRLCESTSPSLDQMAKLFSMMDGFEFPQIGGWGVPRRN